MSVELRRHRRAMFALACVTALSSAAVHVSTAQSPHDQGNDATEKLTSHSAGDPPAQKAFGKPVSNRL